MNEDMSLLRRSLSGKVNLVLPVGLRLVATLLIVYLMQLVGQVLS